MAPEVTGTTLKDLSNVVHLNVEDLDVHLVERNGPQNLNQSECLEHASLLAYVIEPCIRFYLERGNSLSLAVLG